MPLLRFQQGMSYHRADSGHRVRLQLTIPRVSGRNSCEDEARPKSAGMTKIRQECSVMSIHMIL